VRENTPLNVHLFFDFNHLEVLQDVEAVTLSNLQTFHLLPFVNSKQGGRWEETGPVAKKRQKKVRENGSSEKWTPGERRREPLQARWREKRGVRETSTAMAAMRQNWRFEIERRGVHRGVVEAEVVGVGGVGAPETRADNERLACGVGVDSTVEIGGIDAVALRFRVLRTESTERSS